MLLTIYRGLLPVLVVGMFASLFLTQVHASGGLRKVVLSGDVVPGNDDGVKFGSLLLSPVLNGTGQTAFRGQLTGPEVDGTNDFAIFSEGSGSGLALIARAGDAAPGIGGGVSFSSLGDPVLSGSGQTAFHGYVTGPDVSLSNNSVLYREVGRSGPALVAREDDLALGTGARFGNFGHPQLVGNHTVFSVNLTGPGVDATNDFGIFRDTAFRGLALVARLGDPAPGTNVSFDSFGNPVLNARGQTVFHGRLTWTGNDFFQNEGVFRDGVSGLALVARLGDAAPGTDAGVNFIGFGDPVLNSSGHAAFHGELTAPGTRIRNGSGIFSEGGGSGLALVAREGEPAPGIDAGVTFTHFGDPVLNGAGHTAVFGWFSGPGVDGMAGVFSEGGGSGLALVAREGDVAPGTDPGVKFVGFGDRVLLNGNGQVAFFGALTGPGVGRENSHAIFAEDRAGNLRLIARGGDQLDVSDDPLLPDFRTIRHLRYFLGSGKQDGRPSSFNDRGQFAFTAEFTDGTSGVFVSDLATVPEPNSFVLLCLGVIGMKGLRYRFG